MSSLRTILAAFVLFFVTSSSWAQVSRSGMGIFYGASRIVAESFTTNTGDLIEYGGEALAFPHYLYGFSYDTKQVFRHGLEVNYRIILAKNTIAMDDFTDTDFSYEDLSFFNVSFAPELSYALLKNMGYKSLSGRRRLRPFIDNALNVFGGIEFYSPAFAISAYKSGGVEGRESSNADFRNLLFTRKLHFNAYAGTAFRVKRVELGLQYYFYSSPLFGLEITDPLLYRPMITFILKYSI